MDEQQNTMETQLAEVISELNIHIKMVETLETMNKNLVRENGTLGSEKFMLEHQLEAAKKKIQELEGQPVSNSLHDIKNIKDEKK